jgi:hypothetical protein
MVEKNRCSAGRMHCLLPNTGVRGHHVDTAPSTLMARGLFREVAFTLMTSSASVARHMYRAALGHGSLIFEGAIQ